MNGFFQGLDQIKVLVVGDAMIDKYLMGSVDRISPEAPVPVVNFEGSVFKLGGAANVGLNLRAMGAPTMVCATAGDDEEGKIMRELMEEEGMPVEGIHTISKPTTLKTRVMASNQQLLRVDREDTRPMATNEAEAFIANTKKCIKSFQPQVAILQDYNKGIFSPEVIDEFLTHCHGNGIKVCVDPKIRNFYEFKGVDLFKPNVSELKANLPFVISTTPNGLTNAGNYLMDKINSKALMVTLSDKGLYYQEQGQQGRIHPAVQRQVADVSGAGDTVISIAALAMAQNLPVDEMCSLCNLAGGIVCESPGVVPVNPQRLRMEYSKLEKHLWQ